MGVLPPDYILGLVSVPILVNNGTKMSYFLLSKIRILWKIILLVYLAFLHKQLTSATYVSFGLVIDMLINSLIRHCASKKSRQFL